MQHLQVTVLIRPVASFAIDVSWGISRADEVFGAVRNAESQLVVHSVLPFDVGTSGSGLVRLKKGGNCGQVSSAVGRPSIATPSHPLRLLAAVAFDDPFTHLVGFSWVVWQLRLGKERRRLMILALSAGVRGDGV